MKDLTQYAGFSMQFDPQTLALETGDGVSFERIPRTARELIPVLYEPDSVSPDELAYEVTRLASAPGEAQKTLDCLDLSYTLVLVPSKRFGQEFVKTAGHYHPPIPGTHLGFPEVYTQLYGTLYLLLQERSPLESERVTDVRLVKMTPGFTLIIPPNYAHVLINTTSEAALMAGLYGKQFGPEYAFVREHRGLAYYLLAGDGEPFHVQLNPAYPDAPPLARLEDLSGTPFAPPNPGQPVWSAFMANPQRYAFLTQAEEAVLKFSGKV